MAQAETMDEATLRQLFDSKDIEPVKTMLKPIFDGNPDGAAHQKSGKGLRQRRAEFTNPGPDHLVVYLWAGQAESMRYLDLRCY